MELAMPPRMLAQSEGRFQERKKLTMVKAQAYLKAGKTKKSVMLDDFCESTGYCRRHAARVLHLAYLLGDCIPVADPTKHIHRYRLPHGTALWSNRHSSPSGQPAPSLVLSVWQEACPFSWRTSSPMGTSIWMRGHEVSSSR